MKKIPLVVIAAFSCSGLPTLLAQVPAAAPAANLISNGGFERSGLQDNIWDGIDAEGNLAGGRLSLKALAESGFRDMAMPLSVSVGDLNGDGLLDIVTADPVGYMRAYFNSGTKQAPAFTHAEAFPIFLSANSGDRGRAPRINLFDWSRRGMLDLAVGNYFGELYVLANSGSATAPNFTQPADLAKAAIVTTKSSELWANLVAPVAYDFNKDGRIDLAVGEGSYSANSVHLLLNQGSNSAPKFDEEHRYYLAYGDGREHLTPAVADYNGDGEMDILASNREGKVGVYLNPGQLWKPGGEFKYSADIQFGAAPTLGGMVTIATADMNGDDLFDLVIGKASGRVALAVNVGTKTAPKFDAPVDLKGKDIWGRIVHNPSGWEVNVGFEKGNTYGTANCITVEDDAALAPPEGKFALKIGYFPSPNKIFRIPSMVTPGAGNNALWSAMASLGGSLSGNTFVIRHSLPDLKVGSTYDFSYKAKGVGAGGVEWTLGLRALKEIAPKKVTSTGDRGVVEVKSFTAQEYHQFQGSVLSGSAWAPGGKTFVVEKPKDKNLQDLPKLSALLEIRGTLTPNTGALYLDDFQLVEKVK